MELQVAVPEQRLELQLELVLAPQLVRVLVLAQEQVPEQELALQLVQALLVAQPIHCDRCSRVHLLE